MLAAFAVLASDLPGLIACPLALIAVLHGAALARRDLRARAQCVVIPHDQDDATIDGQVVASLELHWRGPLAFLRWRDDQGRWRLLSGCPDNLDAHGRRELRLAMAARAPAGPPRSMAP
jgi:toxin CptA